MRILFVVHHFPPKILGGADMYTYGIADELRRQGHAVWVLCAEDVHDPAGGRNEVRFIDDTYQGLRVRRLSFNWERMADPYGALYVTNPAIEQLTQAYVTEIQPHVVHVTACDQVSNGVITGAQRAGRPVVLTLTGKWHMCPTGTLLRWDGELCSGRQDGLTCLRCMFGETRTYRAVKRLPAGARQAALALSTAAPRLSRSIGSLNFMAAIERRNRQFPIDLRAVDLCISPSEHHRRLFVESGLIAAERIVVSPHGHDTSFAVQGQYKAASARVRFGFTSQVIPHKGLDTLVSAFARLPAGAAELHVWGSLDLEPAYVEHVRRLADGIPGVSFHGGYAREQVGSVLSSLDVVVVPSRAVENAPVVISEAFAAKTPVIGTNAAGIAEAIQHGVNGFLFARDDVDELARHLATIVERPAILEQLRAGIPPIRTVADEAKHLLDHYARLAPGYAQASGHSR